MKRLIYIITFFLVCVLLSACVPSAQEIHTPEPALTETGATDTHLVPAPLSTPTSNHTPSPNRPEVTRMPERVTPEEFQNYNGITGEAPEDLIEQILSDLEKRTGASRQTIQVIRSEAVIWNDGSLGCPKPGEFYTQALVNGFHIILKIGDKEYDYRASQTGYFFLCEGGARLIPSEGTTDS
jgi:hypothetical protein